MSCQSVKCSVSRGSSVMSVETRSYVVSAGQV